MKKREKIQWLSAWYFTAQTSYLRAQEFRNKVTQHKELRVPLNFIHLFTQSRQKNGISVLVRLPETAVLVKQAGNLCTALKRWDAIVPRLGSDKRGCFMGTFRGWVDFSRSCAGRWRKARFLGDGWISAPFCSWARFAETDRHTHWSTCGKLNMCAAEFCQSENITVRIFYSYWLCIILYSYWPCVIFRVIMHIHPKMESDAKRACWLWLLETFPSYEGVHRAGAGEEACGSGSASSLSVLGCTSVSASLSSLNSHWNDWHFQLFKPPK